VPSPLLTEVIYEEELVCVVAADAPYHRQLTLKQYLAAEHIGVDVVEGRNIYRRNVSRLTATAVEP
jgi:DNA-binding transcriptional LysR family regulator